MHLDIDQALDDLRHAFPGICVWHGEFSGSLWALLPDRLVEARTAAGLARQLHAALPRPGAQVIRRPLPPTRRPDGTWTTAKPTAAGSPHRRDLAGRCRHVVRWLLTSCSHLTPATSLS
ncbi:hypothetical protein [Actinomadura chokoriensis]|uniref:Uncharacterized protein n=1 Tax=Actinomadura chokoriensis TaxID=454156 RepID=A0ABV4R5G2_9ACTN